MRIFHELEILLILKNNNKNFQQFLLFENFNNEK